MINTLDTAVVPAGYQSAGTVTVTFRFASGPLSVQEAVLRHDGCGGLVASSEIGRHERLAHPEAAEEGR